MGNSTGDYKCVYNGGHVETRKMSGKELYGEGM